MEAESSRTTRTNIETPLGIRGEWEGRAGLPAPGATEGSRGGAHDPPREPGRA